MSASPWASLRGKVFRWLWIASFVSNIGTWMQTVGAQTFLVDRDAGSAVIALVQTASTLPVLLVTLPAGVIAEFVDRRLMLIAVQGVQVVVGGLLAVLALEHALSPTSLLVLTFLLGLGGAAQVPAYQSFVPQVVSREDLGGAAALSSISVNLARAIGPAVAGLLVTHLGVGVLFVLNTATFAVFGLILLTLHTPRPARTARQPFGDALVTGTRYVRNTPVVRRLTARLVVFVVAANILWALLPQIAHDRLGLGASGYGVLLGAAGVGSVAGALVLPRVRRRVPVSWLYAAAGVVFGAGTAVLATVRSTPVVVAVLVPMGAAWITVLASSNTAVLTALPSWVRARALSIYQVVLFGAFALSAAAWGGIASAVGLEAAFLAAAALLVLGAVSVWRWPVLAAPPGSASSGALAWSTPELVVVPPSDDQPVRITVAYTVDPAAETEFVAAMHDLRRSRLATGGSGWDLYRDAAADDVFVEQYVMPSWADHLAQHDVRRTGADDAVQQRVRAAAREVAPADHLLEVEV